MAAVTKVHLVTQESGSAADDLVISPEKAFFIIVKAREFDEQVAPSDPDSGSNASDDKNVDVVEASADDSIFRSWSRPCKA